MYTDHRCHSFSRQDLYCVLGTYSDLSRKRNLDRENIRDIITHSRRYMCSFGL